MLRDVTAPDQVKVTMLGVSGELKVRREGSTLTIDVPALNPDQAPCRYAFAFKITGASVQPE